MYYIDSEVDKPSLSNMMMTITECMEEGIRIGDTRELREKLDVAIKASAMNLKMSYGIENPNSPQQVTAALQRLHDPNVEDACIVEAYVKQANGKSAKTLKWTSDKNALSKLVHMDYDIAKQIIIYRRASKYADYIDRFTRMADREGLVHPTVSFGKTNRVNYSDPDLMNIPKKILWDVVVPRNDDNILISIDVKNQEPWILVNMLGIESIKQSLETSGEGLYDTLIKIWYGKDFKYNKLQRDEFKTAWNALTYGATKTLAYSICKNIDPDILYKNFKGIEELNEYCKSCRSKGFGGYRKTESVFGTQLECDGAKGVKLANQHMDLKVQATGADILALLIEHFQDRTEEEGINEMIWLYYSRHDELILEADFMLFEIKGEEWVMNFLKDTFEHQIDDWVPFQVDIDIVKPEPLFIEEQDDFGE